MADLDQKFNIINFGGLKFKNNVKGTNLKVPLSKKITYFHE